MRLNVLQRQSILEYISILSMFFFSLALPSLPPTTPDGSLMPYGPIFREKLRNTELQVGTDFRVCVIVEGEPKPDVKL